MTSKYTKIKISKYLNVAGGKTSIIIPKYILVTDGVDDQLKLAIQLSLQESTAAISRQLRESSASAAVSSKPIVASGPFQRTSADITVDCFLKSLANHKIDLKMCTDSNTGNDGTNERQEDGFFKPCSGNEDGRFQISDIHENGFGFADNDDDYDENDVRLKRSHSTGDLCIRRSGRGLRVRPGGESEPRYHLDSDHSSQHDERPEEIVARGIIRPRRHVPAAPTNTSDSLNADMEVCGILEQPATSPAYEEFPPVREKHHKYTSNPFASLKAKLCSAHLPKTGYLSKMAVNKSIGLLSEPKKDKFFCNVTADNRRNSDHSLQKKKNSNTNETNKQTSRKSLSCSKRDNSFSKSTSFLLDSHRFKSGVGSNLRIRICKSPLASAVTSKSARQLETDSSNEYESETGIPKSPTLFISGVSISRTPEPKSPGAALVAGGRQSRSSSLSVPVCSASNNTQTSTSVTAAPVTETHTVTTSEPFTPSLVRSTTPASPKASPHKEATNTSKAKSASEPEREREMFRFPKSSTDGALSSVLHVQESNLSSDDFHEALFLLERSPKTRDSKRRKKSKKKDKEHAPVDRMKEEASSAL